MQPTPSWSLLPHTERPECPRCGMQMMLARIEPDHLHHDKRTFECSNCGNETTEIVRFK